MVVLMTLTPEWIQAKRNKMEAIDRDRAISLVQDGRAGFYASDANPPVYHSSKYVVKVLGRFFLLNTPNEIKLTPAGLTAIGDVPKQATLVELNCDVVAELLQQEMKCMVKLSSEPM